MAQVIKEIEAEQPEQKQRKTTPSRWDTAKRWGLTLFLVYVCLATFFTVLYLGNSRLTVTIGSLSLLK